MMMRVLFTEITVGNGIVKLALFVGSIEISGVQPSCPVSFMDFTRHCQPGSKILKVSFVIRGLEAAFAKSKIEIVVALSLDTYPLVNFQLDVRGSLCAVT